MNKLILKCENLYKNYGNKKIINGVSLELYEKDILGFIGANGEGKTTIIKMILGLQNVNSGNVYINNYNLKNNYKLAIKRVGAIVETPDFYMYLSGRKNLQLSKNLYKNISNSRIDEVAKLVGLENRINDKVSKYSLGMKQRLGIAEAILHKPNLLILDEPTNGLDPEGIKDLREILKNLSEKENIAIFISSHMLSELENLCTKICIIKDGKIIETNDMNNLKGSLNITYKIEVNNVSAINRSDIKILNKNIFKITCNKEELSKLIKSLILKNIKIYKIEEEKLSLEDVFLSKTGCGKID